MPVFVYVNGGGGGVNIAIVPFIGASVCNFSF